MAVEPLPARQLWADAVALPPGQVSSIPTPLMRKGEPIAAVGGKLALALLQPLFTAGFSGLYADRRHPLLADIPGDAPEYEMFGNGYGEVRSARAFRQLVERAARTFAPQEDRWHDAGRVVDPVRPNLRYAAASDREFDVLQERHLNIVRGAFRRARVMLVALAESEVWEAKADGAVFPHWAQGRERWFDPERHGIRTLTVEETIADLNAAIAGLRATNPTLQIVLMVSPEPQPATAHPVHVAVASALGKAVLRIAVETVAQAEGVHYFPALEIASQVAPAAAYGADGTVPVAVAEAVANALIAVSEGGSVHYTGEAPPITVLGAAAEPAAASDTPAPRPKGAKSEGAAPPKRRGVQASPVDELSKLRAAEEAEKKAKRAAKQAQRAATRSEGDAPADKRAAKLAEREAQRAARKAEGAAPDAKKLTAAEKVAERRRARRAEAGADSQAAPKARGRARATETAPATEAATAAAPKRGRGKGRAAQSGEAATDAKAARVKARRERVRS